MKTTHNIIYERSLAGQMDSLRAVFVQVPKIETELNCRQRRSGKTNWVVFFGGGGGKGVGVGGRG